MIKYFMIPTAQKADAQTVSDELYGNYNSRASIDGSLHLFKLDIGEDDGNGGLTGGNVPQSILDLSLTAYDINNDEDLFTALDTLTWTDEPSEGGEV